jgi:hypothetical protein
MENIPPNAIDPRKSAIDELAIQLKADLYGESLEAWDHRIALSNKRLEESAKSKDDGAANCAWFLREIATVRHDYLRAVTLLKQENYYDGWCVLERVEIGLNTICKNPFYKLDDFAIYDLANLVNTWQNIFPYHVFISPEFIIRREECSICHQSVDPWSTCSHEVGKVYCGKHCYRIVTEADLLGVSLVRDPVQKYSVARILNTDENGKQTDQFDYSQVKFVVDRIRTPFTKWTATWTKARHPHALFKNTAHDGACPCDSGKSYRDCCLNEAGVLRPHLEIRFAEDPPANLPHVQLSGYDVRMDVEGTLTTEISDRID